MTSRSVRAKIPFRRMVADDNDGTAKQPANPIFDGLVPFSQLLTVVTTNIVIRPVKHINKTGLYGVSAVFILNSTGRGLILQYIYVILTYGYKDIIAWLGEIRMLQRLQSELELLKDIHICS
jgi:hypothetical protein